ncbi:glycosyltransferase family 2 protein [methane-oxidizing endosymbiont of Gigantopelta aegis]|uniref:glycosyltransferase family 2 protein n=1 Tax=methane-oxidizing endosymbiont of Gigantopelta aegis TaxID=2794938 RepID=UPI001FD8A648|nr:glycosyltransferase family 2 protein [methane-oxidizing endosymbiont of Gigantopelta aegis]
MNTPLISVIMPCYNAEAYVADTVANVFEQSYPNAELIIVDDGSTDKSPQILEQLNQQYDNLRVFYQKNQGPYPARNFALEHAKGEFIAFLDADDYWALDCLEKLYNGLTQSLADLSYCGWQNIVEGGENGPRYIPPAYEKGDIPRACLKGCPWPIHAALTRREIIDQVNGFSTRCFSAMDYDLWIRIIGVTQNITLVPEVLAFYRWHSHGQISSVKWKQVLNARVVRQDFILKNPALVSHIPPDELNKLLNSQVVDQAYEAFWKRNLNSAQHLFRAMLRFGSWQFKDLKYIIISLFPETIFKKIVLFLDK